MNAETLRARLRIYVERPTLLTIGVFDGVHLGHQHLVGGMVERARERQCLAAVVTIHPHPQQVLSPGAFTPAYLTTLSERLERLRALGPDLVAVLHFDREVAGTSAEVFLQSLRESLSFVDLWTGPDFALGQGRHGDSSYLRELGKRVGFAVHSVPPLMVEGEPANSTRIRKLIASGEVHQAAGALGRFPSLRGQVVSGFQRGRTLGFPTANLDVEADLLIPADGVYAAFAEVEGKRYQALVNIGHRPTFDAGSRRVEAYLFDFAGDLYERAITIEFRQRLRGEIRFPGPEALVTQIENDAQRARSILSS